MNEWMVRCPVHTLTYTHTDTHIHTLVSEGGSPAWAWSCSRTLPVQECCSFGGQAAGFCMFHQTTLVMVQTISSDWCLHFQVLSPPSRRFCLHFLLLSLHLSHVTQQPADKQMQLWNWNCILHYVFMHSHRWKKVTGANVTYCIDSVLFSASLCFIMSLFVCRTVFSSEPSSVWMETPAAAQIKWEVAQQSVVRGWGHHIWPHT